MWVLKKSKIKFREKHTTTNKANQYNRKPTNIIKLMKQNPAGGRVT